MKLRWLLPCVMLCCLWSCSGVAETLRAEGFPMPKMGDIYSIAASDTGQVVELWGLVASNGASIAQNMANGGIGQAWLLRPAEDGSFSIINKATRKCLEVPNGSEEGGAPVQQWGCHGSANQRWYLRAQGDGFELANVQSGKCLDRTSDNAKNGAQLQQWGCLGGANQTWKFLSWGGGGAVADDATVSPSANE